LVGLSLILGQPSGSSAPFHRLRIVGVAFQVTIYKAFCGIEFSFGKLVDDECSEL